MHFKAVLRWNFYPDAASRLNRLGVAGSPSTMSVETGATA
jgi:hypothetical protein